MCLNANIVEFRKDECLREDVGISGWLRDTRWEVRDDRGISVGFDGGIGELWIGGDERKCLLPNETWGTAPELRPTGDVVK